MIRKMTNADIKAVQKVAEISWHHTYENIIPIHIQNDFLKSAYNDEMMYRRLERSIVFVAVENNVLLGFANFSFVRPNGNCELAAIYLLPEAQGKGYGTALLNEGLKIPNVKEITLNVERENVIGRRFYEAKGFEVVEELEEDFEGHLLKTARMRLIVEKAN